MLTGPPPKIHGTRDILAIRTELTNSKILSDEHPRCNERWKLSIRIRRQVGASRGALLVSASLTATIQDGPSAFTVTPTRSFERLSYVVYFATPAVGWSRCVS